MLWLVNASSVLSPPAASLSALDPTDWDWLTDNGHLKNDRLTAAATRAKYDALDLIDRLEL
jgi:hypothetical protein